MTGTESKQKIDDLFRQAYLLRANGRWNDAVKTFGQIIGMIPHYAPVYVERGLLLKEMGSLELAKRDFDQAIKIDPKYGLAYYGRGWVRSTLGDFEGELADAHFGLSLDPEHEGWYYRRIGSALTGMKRYEEAVEAYNYAIRINGNQEEGTFYNRGMCFSRMGKYDLALADFNRCLELDPDWAWAFAERGEIYMLQGNLDLAISDFTKAIQYNAKYIPSYFRRALAYEKKGDKKRAAADYKLLLQMNLSPDFRKQVQESLRKLSGFWNF